MSGGIPRTPSPAGRYAALDRPYCARTADQLSRPDPAPDAGTAAHRTRLGPVQGARERRLPALCRYEM